MNDERRIEGPIVARANGNAQRTGWNSHVERVAVEMRARAVGPKQISVDGANQWCAGFFSNGDAQEAESGIRDQLRDPEASRKGGPSGVGDAVGAMDAGTDGNRREATQHSHGNQTIKRTTSPPNAQLTREVGRNLGHRLLLHAAALNMSSRRA